ncbi:MAG: TlpA disulfide reductase family protein [Ferruginibacter sp.]
MQNKILPAFAIASIIFISCSNTTDKSTGETVQPVAVENTKPATIVLPAFKLKGTDGTILNLTDLKGKKLFINLWATWCPPCKAEIPSIEKLYEKVDKESTAFILLSLDDDFETAKKFVKANKMQVPVYYPAENLPALFNTEGIPATFIFNEKGGLIKMNNGMEDYDTEAYVKLLKP